MTCLTLIRLQSLIAGRETSNGKKKTKLRALFTKRKLLTREPQVARTTGTAQSPSNVNAKRAMKEISATSPSAGQVPIYLQPYFKRPNVQIELLVTDQMSESTFW